jgi:hypothetical protein
MKPVASNTKKHGMLHMHLIRLIPPWQPEEAAQLQANNKELMSRVASIEQSVATDNGGGGDATSTSNSVWYDNMIKSMTILAAIAGLIFVDFIWARRRRKRMQRTWFALEVPVYS